MSYDKIFGLIGLVLATIGLIVVGLPSLPQMNDTPSNETRLPFPEGASEDSIQPETLLTSHNETLRGAQSVTFTHSIRLTRPPIRGDKRETLNGSQYGISINKTTRETRVVNQTTEQFTQQYRTGTTVYNWRFLNQSVTRNQTTEPFPVITPDSSDNRRAVARYRALLSLNNITYSGIVEANNVKVHEYQIRGNLLAADPTIGDPNQEFVSGQYQLYVHPDGYIYSAKGSILVTENESFKEYIFTESTSGINATQIERPVWASTNESETATPRTSRQASSLALRDKRAPAA